MLNRPRLLIRLMADGDVSGGFDQRYHLPFNNLVSGTALRGSLMKRVSVVWATRDGKDFICLGSSWGTEVEFMLSKSYPRGGCVTIL